jgi:hypothetical protein
LRRATAGLTVAEREAWLVRHRLEPLVYGVEELGLDVSPAFLAACHQAYCNMAARAVRFRAEIDRMCAGLRAAGIPVLAWRGVVAGETLYGDPGLRYCTDIDLLVAPGDQHRSLAAAKQLGYGLRAGLSPQWFLARHHLHWPLMHRESGIPLDLHWAVDHPYRGLPSPAFPGEALSGNNALLFAVRHAEKEARLWRFGDGETAAASVLSDGPLLPWLDVLLLRGAYDRAAWAAWIATLDRATARVAQRVAWVIDRIEGRVPAPETGSAFVGSETGDATDAPKAVVWIARAVGCRTDALMDWTDYLRDPVSWGERMLRTARVGRLAFDAALCGAWMAARGRRTS